MSPLRAWWTGDVCVSLLPLMWAPTQVCVTHSGPNGKFRPALMRVCTNTQTLVTSDLNLKPEAARGKVMSWIGAGRQTDWLTDWYWTLAPIDDTQRALSPSASSVVFRTEASAILFILLLVSYLVPKVINVPTCALLHLVDALISTPIFSSAGCTNDNNCSRFYLKLHSCLLSRPIWRSLKYTHWHSSAICWVCT